MPLGVGGTEKLNEPAPLGTNHPSGLLGAYLRPATHHFYGLSNGPLVTARLPVSLHYIPSNFAFWAANSSSVRIPSCFSFPSLSSCATVSSETPPSSGAA